MKNLGLTFDLPIGFRINGEYTREIELLPSNSVAEEVFTRKMAQQPFTWIAQVITIATGRIGRTEVGQKAREEYYKSGKITIPQVVKNLPWADANTMLLEIHRRVWERELKSQNTMCRFCTKEIEIDIDLNRIEMSEDNREILSENPEFDGLSVDLNPFKLSGILNHFKDEQMKGLSTSDFDRIVFRVPTIGDALMNERYFDKNIELWRRIGADCMQLIQKVGRDEEGLPIEEAGQDIIIHQIPESNIRFIALKVFKELMSDNLKTIRHSLREELPVIPFAYTDTCACDMNRPIPYVLDSSGFFSE